MPATHATTTARVATDPQRGRRRAAPHARAPFAHHTASLPFLFAATVPMVFAAVATGVFPL
ncbi:hypothetical protein WS75_22305 [Burkholderia sp. FL-7-2-10-S1-D7]|nr:hypothetical protein WS75_22305 [Burkholderia sp. FL-7-2-10-S1-D7]